MDEFEEQTHMQALEFAKELIRFDSRSQLSNAAVSNYVEDWMQRTGFETERIDYMDSGVLKSSVVGRLGQGAEGLAYFGHTDVVPVEGWSSEIHGPFEPTVKEGRLYGRGSTDMKGSIACMLAAVSRIGTRNLRNPIYISCSADEEIDHRGAIEIASRSKIYRELVTGGARGIVGEPTELKAVYAHKGGCQIFVTSHGRAAHSSTRNGLNANLAMIPFLSDMKHLYEQTETEPDWHDDEFDPPTICLNLGINDNNRALNITSPQSICSIAFRPMPSTDTNTLTDRIKESAEYLGLDFQLRRYNPPFRRDPSSSFIRHCIRVGAGTRARTAAYGTEASNFPEVSDLVVMGPGNIEQAHRDDEWISIEQLSEGQRVYSEMIRQFCL